MAKKRNIAFIGSECYPFVKTGGLGDVMYALPRALVGEGCEVRVIIPLYACIPQRYKEKMVHKGSFMMDLTLEGRTFFVGIMELEKDGVIYDFVENKEFFDWGNPLYGPVGGHSEVLLLRQGFPGNHELPRMGAGHHPLPSEATRSTVAPD